MFCILQFVKYFTKPIKYDTLAAFFKIMTENGLLYFALLKKEIAGVLKQSYPSVDTAIENWKGQDIVYLQDDLMNKVKGTISEKWFYTHIKLTGNKLPRIDMLNLLSRYAGYLDWNDFKEKKKQDIPVVADKRPAVNSTRIKIGIFVLACLLVVLIYSLLRPKTYTFCFCDANEQTLLTEQNIEIIILNEGESPIYRRCEKGCFSLKSKESKIRFIVKTPYYRTDTITRILKDPDRSEIVKLHTNDYAMMIHFFSKSKLEDWQKRRKQLNVMFTDNAQIYQVYGEEEIGMELYNKTEFINKLTMPLRSLQNIEVIETIYNGNQISVLKFRQIQKQKQ